MLLVVGDVRRLIVQWASLVRMVTPYISVIPLVHWSFHLNLRNVGCVSLGWKLCRLPFESGDHIAARLFLQDRLASALKLASKSGSTVVSAQVDLWDFLCSCKLTPSRAVALLAPGAPQVPGPRSDSPASSTTSWVWGSPAEEVDRLAWLEALVNSLVSSLPTAAALKETCQHILWSST